MSIDLISRKKLMNHIEEQRRQWGEDYDVEQILGDIEDMSAEYDMDKTAKYKKRQEDKYIIIKREDTLKYLEEPEQTALDEIVNKIVRGRAKDNKNPVNFYYVCNTDEPYAEVVRGIIIGGEAVKLKLTKMRE